jgi:two-component system OmpR family sensor kinase
MRLPIRVRMTAWYIALLAVIIAAVAAFLVLRLRADLVAAMDHRLRPAVAQLALGYHAEGPPEARDLAGSVLTGEGAAAQVLTPAGRVVTSYGDPVSRAPLLAPSELRAVLDGHDIDRTASLGARQRRFRIVTAATTRGDYPRVVVAAESMATIDRSVHRLLVLLLLACPAAVLITAAGGWWLARRSLRPISRLTSEAEQINMERLTDRLPVPATGDEVARLAATLNAMLARIETGVEDQRRLIADTSHELRTPLAAMRAELDVSLRADDLDPPAQEVLRSTREEVERLSRTVDGLLALARADRGALDLRPDAVDLAVLARETLERLAPLAREGGVTLAARLDHAVTAGDARWLGRAIDNLVDNAIKFSPADGTITVTTGHDGGEVRVSVLDEGPGIPADAREAVFDRFRRLDASRSRATGGSGIGLSIVREIAWAHGGRTWTQPGPRGGSLFVLALPGTRSDNVDDAADVRAEAVVGEPRRRLGLEALNEEAR